MTQMTSLKYLKDRNPIINKNVHKEPKVGIMNGLWANAIGKGGVIPIEVQFYLSNNDGSELQGLAAELDIISLHFNMIH